MNRSRQRFFDALGIEGEALPMRGCAAVAMPQLEGNVYVRPLTGDAPVIRPGPFARTRRRMSHRLRFVCWRCGADISAGRVEQHRKSCRISGDA